MSTTEDRSRRDFLRRAGATGVAMGAALGAADPHSRRKIRQAVEAASTRR